jgi:AraC-like DNA-binding protein
MDLVCDERPSESPFVERVWRSHTGEGGTFISMAQQHWGIVVMRHKGKLTLTVRGPETCATLAESPPDTEFFGILFKAGAYMPDFPVARLINRQDVNLPEAASHSFWLKGSAWQYPTFENVDTFVNRLSREELLVHDPLVSAVLSEQRVDVSDRTAQRRLLQATGLTQGACRQIERARYATALLKQGVSILDTVQQAGYADQPHLTRALKRLIGQTPAQIGQIDRAHKLSFLYKFVSFG